LNVHIKVENENVVKL